MNKLSKRILIGAIIGAVNLTGCSSDHSNDVAQRPAIVEEQDENQNDKFETVMPSTNEEVQEPVQEEVQEEVVQDSTQQVNDIISRLDVVSKDVVTTNLRTMVTNSDGGTLGYLGTGVTVSLLGEENGKYYIQYYDTTGYVTKDFVTRSTIVDINSNFNKVLYATSDVELTIPDYLSSTNSEQKVTIPTNELFEVFDENNDIYVVRTNNYVGYISHDNVNELTGTFVVVDISDQSLKLYNDNNVILTTPVITGKETTPTHEGLWHVYSISHHRDLVGANYTAYVDHFIAFNDGEGLHDAEYHSCSYNANHGWRNAVDFGGEKYLRSGSHGCVNMLRDAVEVVNDYAYIDMPVLVKK